MPWGRCDDTFYRHAKVGELDPDMELAAIGMYWKAISWSNDQLTDGRVPGNVVRTLGGSVALADELVRVGLWERGDSAYQIHDFADYNRTKVQVLADRAQRVIAGKLGADARWRPHGGSPSEPHGEMDGEPPYDPPSEMDAPYPVPRSPITKTPHPVTKKVPAAARRTWPTDVPEIVQNAWHRKMKHPPSKLQIAAIRAKPRVWLDVALLIDTAPAGAKAFEIVNHVLNGLTAKIAAEHLEEARRVVKKEPGRPGGEPTKVGDALANLRLTGAAQ